MGFHAWQLYTVLSESNSSSELEPQLSNPNHKTSGSFGVYGGHSVSVSYTHLTLPTSDLV